MPDLPGPAIVRAPGIRATVLDSDLACDEGWPDERPTLPGPGEVHVWRLDCAPSTDRVRAAAELLDADESARAAAMRAPGAAERYAVARAATRRLLGAIIDFEPGSLRFTRHCAVCGEAGHGRPQLQDAAGVRLHFSLSHAVDIALVAVANDPRLGVDVETVARAGDPALGPAFLAPAEAAAIAALPAAERPVAATRSWCRKEALLKGHGFGIVGDLTRLSMGPEASGRLACPGIRATDDGIRDGHAEPDDTVRWELLTLRPGPGYRAAVAALGPWRARCRSFPG